ncbi:MAG: cysteine-rich CWC family protein [Bacteroidota bacterium]
MNTNNPRLDTNKTLKRCPECGKFFGCANDGDCWCHDVQVSSKNMLLLRHKYDDCICQECLGKYAD